MKNTRSLIQKSVVFLNSSTKDLELKILKIIYKTYKQNKILSYKNNTTWPESVCQKLQNIDERNQ